MSESSSYYFADVFVSTCRNLAANKGDVFESKPGGVPIYLPIPFSVANHRFPLLSSIMPSTKFPGSPSSVELCRLI